MVKPPKSWGCGVATHQSAQAPEHVHREKSASFSFVSGKCELALLRLQSCLVRNCSCVTLDVETRQYPVVPFFPYTDSLIGVNVSKNEFAPKTDCVTWLKRISCWWFKFMDTWHIHIWPQLSVESWTNWSDRPAARGTISDQALWITNGQPQSWYYSYTTILLPHVWHELCWCMVVTWWNYDA